MMRRMSFAGVRVAIAVVAFVQMPQHASGQTILLVTHDDEVAEAGDRIVRMRDGRVVTDDDASVDAAPASV